MVPIVSIEFLTKQPELVVDHFKTLFIIKNFFSITQMPGKVIITPVFAKWVFHPLTMNGIAYGLSEAVEARFKVKCGAFVTNVDDYKSLWGTLGLIIKPYYIKIRSFF